MYNKYVHGNTIGVIMEYGLSVDDAASLVCIMMGAYVQQAVTEDAWL
jgi:antirestriction protein